VVENAALYCLIKRGTAQNVRTTSKLFGFEVDDTISPDSNDNYK